VEGEGQRQSGNVGCDNTAQRSTVHGHGWACTRPAFVSCPALPASFSWAWLCPLAHAAGFTPHHCRGVRSLAHGRGCWVAHSCIVVANRRAACLCVLHERRHRSCAPHRRLQLAQLVLQRTPCQQLVAFWLRIFFPMLCVLFRLQPCCSVCHQEKLHAEPFMIPSLDLARLGVSDTTCCTMCGAWGGCTTWAGCGAESVLLVWC
jgi:hypothetical protein